MQPILLVDDDPGDRQRLEQILFSMGTPREALITVCALAEARAHLGIAASFALALVDIALPDGSGIDLIVELRAANSDLGILVISMHGAQDEILGALRAGASGYMLKDRDDLEIAYALRVALRGGSPIDPFIARRIIEELPSDPDPSNSDSSDPAPDSSGSSGSSALTAREREILRLVAAGFSNREIAGQLNRSINTVERHIKNIYAKLAVSSRVQAVRRAQLQGLLKP